MWMARHPLAVIAAGAIAASCGAGPLPSVGWVDYLPGLKVDLDAATTAKDCILLTTYRDMAIEGDPLLESKPRDAPNTDLVAYIEWSLMEAGCW
jgi:hypothetical protein